MKNIFKLLSFACVSLAFTACVEDIDTPDRGPQPNPEKEIAGVYQGTWTVSYKEATTTTEYSAQGDVVVTPKEYAYAADVTAKVSFVENAGLNLDNTSAANISPLTNANSYQVYNSVTPNGFSKKLDNDGTILDLNTQFMGQIFPRDAQGELTKTDSATLEFVLDFTYTYQKTIIVNRRPRKVDCEEKYHFVGYLNK